MLSYLLKFRWSHGNMEHGLMYEGVPEHVLSGAEEGPSNGSGKRIYMGASAGQSVILQSLDHLVGVKHAAGTSL